MATTAHHTQLEAQRAAIVHREQCTSLRLSAEFAVRFAEVDDEQPV